MHYTDIMEVIKEFKTFLIIVVGAVITVIGALSDNKYKLKDKQNALLIRLLHVAH